VGKFRQKKFYRLNHYIQAPEVRVVDEKGKQIGLMPTREAISKAQNLKLDLVEVAPNARPPVCKIIDFKKFKYLEKKKVSGQKNKKSETKEIRLKPFIAKNDLSNRLEKAKSFLKEKNQVRISIVFRGRQIAKKEFGYKLLATIKEKLAAEGELRQESKFMGRRLIAVFSPNEKSKQKTKAQDKKVDQKKV
jgi:translation initiation factor IF-3